METGALESKKLKPEILEAIEYISEFEMQTNIKMLTAEGRLLKLIKNNPGHYLKYYLSQSGLSPRWFGILVDQLLKADLIVRERCEKDIRGKRLK
jgi:DNA-binding MarR family transcriptional regulator